VSLDGKSFFYPNPLESQGQHARSPWFGCACCPGNVTRFIASVPGYVYATDDEALYVNLFAAGEAQVNVAGQTVSVKQETRYPWDGAVRITIEPERRDREFAVKVRIPGWARNQPVPSDLYSFLRESDEQATIKLNGEPQAVDVAKGYAEIVRAWKKGDVVELNLPMPVRRVLCHSQVEENVGKVALQRGPIVYCVEWPDVAGGHVLNLLLPDDEPLSATYEDGLLGGVEVVRGKALALRWAEPEGPVLKEDCRLLAIPYYAWAHRGRGEMAVWLARTETAARPLPAPTIASTSRATSSGGDATALNDQREPKSSGDHSNRFLHWWPRKGTEEWVQYDFQKPKKVSSVEVYWFDDTGRGECRLPASWQLFYREGDQWKPVTNADQYGVEKDKYNKTTFDPVETDGLRIEVQLPEKFSAGIHEWRIE
jgi:hypothetical protein